MFSNLQRLIYNLKPQTRFKLLLHNSKSQTQNSKFVYVYLILGLMNM